MCLFSQYFWLSQINLYCLVHLVPTRCRCKILGLESGGWHYDWVFLCVRLWRKCSQDNWIFTAFICFRIGLPGWSKQMEKSAIRRINFLFLRLLVSQAPYIERANISLPFFPVFSGAGVSWVYCGECSYVYYLYSWIGLYLGGRQHYNFNVQQLVVKNFFINLIMLNLMSFSQLSEIACTAFYLLTIYEHPGYLTHMFHMDFLIGI